MRQAIKSAIALLAVSALPLVSVAPAAAVEYDRLDFTIDCVVGETGEENDHYLAEGETLVVTLENCEGFYVGDLDDTETATMSPSVVLTSTRVVIPAGVVTLTIDGPADIDFEDDDNVSLDEEFDIDLNVHLVGSVNDPESTLLSTQDVTVELGAEEMMMEDDGLGQALLGGNEACALEPGPHVYETLEFTVNETGTFDFRTIAVDPLSKDLNWGLDRNPSGDPFIAIYRSFDPSSPEEGVIGCNDDADGSEIEYVSAAFDSSSELASEDGDVMYRRFPWFQTDLEPGEYTLVLTFFLTVGTSNFGIGEYEETSMASSDTWEPGPQTATFELWGPEGGLEVGHGLADTGVEPGLALWSGLALAGTGVAITVARRRSQRA